MSKDEYWWVREELAARIAVSDAMWEELVEYGFVVEYIATDDLDGLVARAQQWARRAVQHARGRSSTPKSQPETTLPPDEREQALAELLANEMADDEKVIRFREKHLSDGLLTPDQVDEWIESNRRQDGTPTVRFAVPVPLTADLPGRLSEALAETVTKIVAGDLPWLIDLQETWLEHPLGVLKYGEDRWHVAISEYGVLGDLWSVVEHLRRRMARMTQNGYYWDGREAAAFVLTGYVPPIPRSRAHGSFCFEFPTLSAVHIVALAHTGTNDIAGTYRTLRDAVSFGKRNRARHAKTIRVARFATARNDGRTWRAAMEEWNEIYPDQTYTAVKNFIRDSKQGHRLITGGPELTWHSARSRSRSNGEKSDGNRGRNE
jgi:hypothetical protein